MTFKEWLVRRQYPEMVGTGAVYDGTKSPDFNWWGAPESEVKPKKKRKKKKHKKNESFGDSFSRAQWAYDNMSPGDDEVDCPECRGEGTIECDECQKGKVACDCNKDPNCEYCAGTGMANCEECNGTGERACRECEGSGVVDRSHAKGYYDDQRDYDDDDRY